MKENRNGLVSIDIPSTTELELKVEDIVLASVPGIKLISKFLTPLMEANPSKIFSKKLLSLREKSFLSNKLKISPFNTLKDLLIVKSYL